MEDKLRIEKNIPIPERFNRSIFRKMVVGDSIFYKNEDNKIKILQRARANVSYSDKHKKYKFRAKEVDGGVRIWRIK